MDNITLSRIQRSVRMAFIKAKSEIPVDTGTLRGALIAQKTVDGFNIHFIDQKINPKSKKRVGEYKQYPDIRGKSAGYWKKFVDKFNAELGSQLNGRVKGGK